MAGANNEQTPAKNQIIDYYTSANITRQLLENSRGREVAFAYPDGRFDKRPNILQYPSDIAQTVKKGVTSFHFSVERWSNAMGLTADKDNYDSLRVGWDFVLDIDSKLGIEEARMAALLITKLFHKYGIKNYGVKFSGRRGFHIVIPWEMLPKEIDYKPLAMRYPEIPRALALFIRNRIAKQLTMGLLSSKDARQMLDAFEDKENINPYQLVEVEKDWGNRHMFRAPFSINEKTWLVSMPVKNLENFRKEDATMESAMRLGEARFFFGEEGEAASLLSDAIDWYSLIKKEEKPKRKIIKWENKIPEEHFPPCMKLALAGMEDGKKRSIFTLMNFLRMMNWQPEEIEERIKAWNRENKPPLPGSTVLGQLRYHERRETIPPANCDSSMYYQDIGMCRPDAICKGGTDKITIRNPINYPFRKMKPGKKEEKQEKKIRGFSCGICNQECRSVKALKMHMGRYH